MFCSDLNMYYQMYNNIVNFTKNVIIGAVLMKIFIQVCGPTMQIPD